MPLYCKDCGGQAKPGDILCTECGGPLVGHELDVPEVTPFRPADDSSPQESDPDLDELLSHLELPAEPKPAAAAPAVPTPASDAIDLDELLAEPAAPASPTAEFDFDLASVMAEPTAAPAADTGLDDLDLAAAPPAAAPAGDLDLASLAEVLGMPARHAPAPRPSLGFVEADISGAVTRYPLEGATMIIGRIDPGVSKPEIDLSRDDAVSRKHAELHIQGPRVALVDLGSTNGTQLNGQACRPQEEYVLSNGDKITLGEKCVLTIHL